MFFSKLQPPVRNRFDGMQFLADVDRPALELRENNTDSERLHEIESTTNYDAKYVREKMMDEAIQILVKF